MNRGLVGLAIFGFADPARASGVQAGNIAPVMIAPVLAASALALVVGVLVSKNHGGPRAWIAGGAVLVLTVVLSRLLAGFGLIVAIIPQIIVGFAVLCTQRKAKI